jgi:hypothetical protein
LSEGESDRGLALATAGDAFISVWREPSTLARLERLRQIEQALVDRCKGGIVVLTVMIDSSAATKAGEPEAASKLAKHFAPTTRAHAYVIEGSGFRAAALRAVIAGVNAISRPGHPTRVFDRATDAIEWLAPYGQAIDAATLTAALAEARTQIA